MKKVIYSNSKEILNKQHREKWLPDLDEYISKGSTIKMSLSKILQVTSLDTHISGGSYYNKRSVAIEIYNQMAGLSLPSFLHKGINLWYDEFRNTAVYQSHTVGDRLTLLSRAIEDNCMDHYLFFVPQESDVIWTDPEKLADHLLYKEGIPNIHDEDAWLIRTQEIHVIVIFKNEFIQRLI
jgi:hypothetical protein